MSDLGRPDTFLHKTHIKVLLVPRLDMCRSILLLSKIAHQMWHDTHLAKEAGQQKKQLGWRLEVTEKWGRGGWTKFGVSNIGGSS